MKAIFDRHPFFSLICSNIRTVKSTSIALTFDDGPNRKVTRNILRILKTYGVKGTFFVIGSKVEENPEVLIQTNEEGHWVGNHSYSHKSLFFANKAQIESEIRKCDDAIFRKINKIPSVFRPPFGYATPTLFETSKKLLKKVVYWSLNSEDWKGFDTKSIQKRLERKFFGGCIVLMHDGHHLDDTVSRQPTIDVLPFFIEFCLKKNISFVSCD